MFELLKTFGVGFLFILLLLLICGIFVAMICILDGFALLVIAYPGILGPIIIVAVAFMVGLVIRRETCRKS